jgi:hypothetical protein
VNPAGNSNPRSSVSSAEAMAAKPNRPNWQSLTLAGLLSYWNIGLFSQTHLGRFFVHLFPRKITFRGILLGIFRGKNVRKIGHCRHPGLKENQQDDNENPFSWDSWDRPAIDPSSKGPARCRTTYLAAILRYSRYLHTYCPLVNTGGLSWSQSYAFWIHNYNTCVVVD